MNINNLIVILKKKISTSVKLQSIEIDDLTYLHKKHKSHEQGKFHISIKIKSVQLKQMKKIEYSRLIFSLISKEIEDYIHSIKLNIN